MDRRRIELPQPRLDGAPAALVRFAAGAWPLRAAEELRSALIFRALARVDRSFAPIVGDELRHARLCRLVGARLGAAPPVYDVAPVRTRLAQLPSPAQRAGALALVEAAMGETVSSMLFAAGARGAVEPLTRAALGAILRDEVRHARAGWRATRARLAKAGDEERAFLQAEATRGFAALERDVAIPALRRLERGELPDPRVAELGVLLPERRVDTFYRAVERLVIPRLTSCGLDGARAWAHRHAREAPQ